jgi:molybdenum cofactor cytidylyltransferase
MTGVVILAAGNSSRLRQPKQKLLFKGKTLLENAIDAATHSVCTPIIVVLGALKMEITVAKAFKSVFIIKNENWCEGIAASIRCGISELQRVEPAAINAIIMLCDQPFADAVLLNKLVEKQSETQKEIVSCEYKSTLGVPVLFHKTFFSALLQLKGEEGAKKIVFDNQASLATIPFPLGHIDIDTREDYKKLTGNNGDLI